MVDDVAAAEQRLRSHLDRLGWGEDARVAVASVGAPGWTFFTVTRPADPELPELEGETRSFVVRDDGAVASGPPEEELSRLLCHLDLLRAPQAVAPEGLARAALMLAGRPASVVSGEEAARWRERVTGAELAGPSLETTPGGARLGFWAQLHPGPGKRPLTFLHVVVSVDGDYRCRLSLAEHTVRF